MTAVNNAARSRVVHRARNGNSELVWVNVRRGHACSPHTSRGFTTTTSIPPAWGRSFTRCRHHACTRADTTPQPGQPLAMVSALTITRRPPKGKSIASIT